MSKVVTVINGPNLNMLGKREPDIYGSHSLQDVETECMAFGKKLNIDCRCLQSNHEGQLIDWIQEARDHSVGIVINAGAYSHTSIGILDALNVFEGPVIEVHISNIHNRELFRHHSFISSRAEGVIVGCGVQGYSLALQRLDSLLS